jgi:hypothetical protein
MAIGFGKCEAVVNGISASVPSGQAMKGPVRTAQGHARKDADGAPRANAVAMRGAGHPTAGERGVQGQNNGFLRRFL